MVDLPNRFIACDRRLVPVSSIMADRSEGESKGSFPRLCVLYEHTPCLTSCAALLDVVAVTSLTVQPDNKCPIQSELAIQVNFTASRDLADAHWEVKVS